MRSASNFTMLKDIPVPGEAFCLAPRNYFVFYELLVNDFTERQ